MQGAMRMGTEAGRRKMLHALIQACRLNHGMEFDTLLHAGVPVDSRDNLGNTSLLISAQPCLRGEVAAIEQYILDTAVPRTTTQECGGIPGSQVPNNTYGWGAIRAAPSFDLCWAPIYMYFCTFLLFLA